MACLLAINTPNNKKLTILFIYWDYCANLPILYFFFLFILCSLITDTNHTYIITDNWSLFVIFYQMLKMTFKFYYMNCRTQVCSLNCSVILYKTAIFISLPFSNCGFNGIVTKTHSYSIPIRESQKQRL